MNNPLTKTEVAVVISAVIVSIVVMGIVGVYRTNNTKDLDGTRSEFTPTLVAAYQKLKKGETITGREYLALNEMVREHARVQKTNPSPNEDNTQLEELCVLMQIDPQELIALVMDTEGVTVQRTSPWDGNSTHHL